MEAFLMAHSKRRRNQPTSLLHLDSITLRKFNRGRTSRTSKAQTKLPTTAQCTQNSSACFSHLNPKPESILKSSFSLTRLLCQHSIRKCDWVPIWKHSLLKHHIHHSAKKTYPWQHGEAATHFTLQWEHSLTAKATAERWKLSTRLRPSEMDEAKERDFI